MFLGAVCMQVRFAEARGDPRHGVLGDHFGAGATVLGTKYRQGHQGGKESTGEGEREGAASLFYFCCRPNT